LKFSYPIEEEFQSESEIKGYQNIQTSKHQGFRALLEEESGRKGVFGLGVVGRERGEEQIVISQAIRILNLSWYDVSHMHLKTSRLYG
jgi:hypothetical protein